MGTNLGYLDCCTKLSLTRPPPNQSTTPPGTVIHVLAQWDQTWSHVARCVGADALRIAGWVAVASLTGAAIGSVTGSRRRDEDGAAEGERGSGTPPPAGAVTARLQPVIAQALEGAAGAGGAGRVLLALPTGGSGGDTGAMLSRQQCLANPGAPRLAGTPPPTDGAALGSAAAAMTAAAIHGAASAAGRAATSGRVASVGGAVAAAAGGAAQHALRQIGVGLPLGTLAGWLLSGGGSLGLARCLAGVLGVEVEELVNQHGLSAMRPCFDSNTGELHARFCRRMRAWPHLGERGEVVLKAVAQVARWTLPSFLCHDNMGVWTMLSRTAMVEARCSRLEGYEPIEDPTDVAFDRMYDISPEDLAGASQTRAAASGAPSDLLAPDEAAVAGAGVSASAPAMIALARPGMTLAELMVEPLESLDSLPVPIPVPADMHAMHAHAHGHAHAPRAMAMMEADEESDGGREQVGSVELAPAAAAAASAAARAAAAAATARHAGEREAAAAALSEAEGRVRRLEEEFIGDDGAAGVRTRVTAIEELERRRAALAAVTAALAGRRAEAGEADSQPAALPGAALPADSGSSADTASGSNEGAAAEVDEDWELMRHEARRQRRRGRPGSFDVGVGGEPLAGAAAAAATAAAAAVDPMDCDGDHGAMRAAAAVAVAQRAQQALSAAREQQQQYRRHVVIMNEEMEEVEVEESRAFAVA